MTMSLYWNFGWHALFAPMMNDSIQTEGLVMSCSSSSMRLMNRPRPNYRDRIQKIKVRNIRLLSMQ